MKTRTNATGRPGKIGPAASRFPYSRPPLRDSTQVMGLSKSKAKPSEGTPQGPVDRGFAADYFGASPVASALNLPQERDSPENRNQTTMQSPPARSKPDISTLQGIGHFYFALTGFERFERFERFCRAFFSLACELSSPSLRWRPRGVEPIQTMAASKMDWVNELQEVFLKTIAKKISWMDAAEIAGMSVRNMQRRSARSLGTRGCSISGGQAQYAPGCRWKRRRSWVKQALQERDLSCDSKPVGHRHGLTARHTR